MLWENELDQILSSLNVEQEKIEQKEAKTLYHITQVSRSHPGVSYRFDMTNVAPELRVYIPARTGELKVCVYLVCLTPGSFLFEIYERFMAYEGGSQAFLNVEGCIFHHLFLMLMNGMGQLFWQGDPDTLCFPSEIRVSRLV